jgi:phosphoserine phosphatase RsbU/P
MRRVGTVAIAYQSLLANLWPTAMMLFGIYFPERLALDRRWPWAKWLVIAPVLVISSLSVVMIQVML